jgi:hypothetical protein
VQSGPQNETRQLKSLRPWFLVLAMVVTWLSGVYGVTAGCGTVVYLREGRVPDETHAIADAQAIAARADSSGRADASAAVFAYRDGAEMRAIAAYGKVMLPISVAQVLLSILLVAASAMALAGRPGSRSFALQTLAANAAFAAIAYVAKTDLREQWVTETFNAAQQIGGDPIVGKTKSSLYWFSAIGLAFFEIVVVGFAALAMLSKRTTLFLEAVARAEEQREREDEP